MVTELYLRLRWLHWPAILLVLVLQRFPVLRAWGTWESVASVRTVTVLQGLFVSALAASDVHAQAGATTLSPAPGRPGNPGRGQVGVPFEGAVAIVGAPLGAASYEVTGDLPPGLKIEGLNGNIFNGVAVPITGTPSEAGSFTIFLRAWNKTNLEGEGGQTAFDFQFVIEEGSEEQFTLLSSPSSTDVAPGSSVVFSVSADSNLPISHQWYRHRSGEQEPQALVGETSPDLTLSNVSAANMGFYFARITSGATTVDSGVAVLTVQGGSSYLANLSTRGLIPAGGALTPGFVLRGDGSKDLVIRAVGPELADFGVTSALADPALALVPLSASDPVLANDNWQEAENAGELAQTSATLGAFPLKTGSRDAAVLTTISLPNSVQTRGFTVQITGTGSASGIALAEVYDPDSVGEVPRLSNISARGFSGLDANVLAPGFVITGDGPKTMLIRVVGPTLADFGVPDTMVDPRLEVIPSGQTFAIATNDNWSGTAELKAAFATTGAFNFPDDNSRDAAVLVTLPPGGYTVRPSGVADGIGVILVEAYEVLTP
ncbi:MAG: hypothetical protein SynsKO_10860 [Synoicihabitans sp.]